MRHRDWPGTFTPNTATELLAPRHWPAAVAAPAPPGSTKPSAAVAPAGPRVASGRGQRLDQRAGPRSARRSLPGCREVRAPLGRSPTGRASGPRTARSVAAGRAQECRALRDAIDIQILPHSGHQLSVRRPGRRQTRMARHVSRSPSRAADHPWRPDKGAQGAHRS